MGTVSKISYTYRFKPSPALGTSVSVEKQHLTSSLQYSTPRCCISALKYQLTGGYKEVLVELGSYEPAFIVMLLYVCVRVEEIVFSKLLHDKL